MDPIIRAVTLVGGPRPLKRPPPEPRPVTVLQDAPDAAAPNCESQSASQAESINHQLQQELEAAREAAKLEQALNQVRAELAEELETTRATMRDDVAEELEQARIEAERRGYAAGLAQGEADARAKMQAEVGRLAAVANELERARCHALHSAEEALIEIVFAALARMVPESVADREQVRQTVQHLVGQARAAGAITVRVHPADLALIAPEDGEPQHFDTRISFRADADVALGGCIVEGAQGRLDMRIESQIGQLKEALVATRQERLGGGGQI